MTSAATTTTAWSAAAIFVIRSITLGTRSRSTLAAAARSVVVLNAWSAFAVTAWSAFAVTARGSVTTVTAAITGTALAVAIARRAVAVVTRTTISAAFAAGRLQQVANRFLPGRDLTPTGQCLLDARLRGRTDGTIFVQPEFIIFVLISLSFDSRCSCRTLTRGSPFAVTFRKFSSRFIARWTAATATATSATRRAFFFLFVLQIGFGLRRNFVAEVIVFICGIGDDFFLIVRHVFVATATPATTPATTAATWTIVVLVLFFAVYVRINLSVFVNRLRQRLFTTSIPASRSFFITPAPRWTSFFTTRRSSFDALNFVDFNLFVRELKLKALFTRRTGWSLLRSSTFAASFTSRRSRFRSGFGSFRSRFAATFFTGWSLITHALLTRTILARTVSTTAAITLAALRTFASRFFSVGSAAGFRARGFFAGRLLTSARFFATRIASATIPAILPATGLL